MPSFISIQNRVKRNVIDAPAAVLAEIPNHINDAMREIQESHNFIVMRTLPSAFTTTAATRSIGSVPSDFKGPWSHPYFLTYTGKVYEMLFVPSEQIGIAAYGDDSSVHIGHPALLAQSAPTNDAGAATFSVYPYSDSNSDYGDGEYRIYVPYYRYLTELSADTDSNWFTTNADRFLEYRALEACFRQDWDESRADYWGSKADKQKTMAINRDKMAQISDMDTLVIHRGARAPKVRA